MKRAQTSLSVDDVGRALAASEGITTVLLEVLYASGGRVSEIVALRWGDINFEEHTVRLQGKGGDERLCPIGHPALAALRSWRDGHGCRLVQLDSSCQPSPSSRACESTKGSAPHHTQQAEPDTWGNRACEFQRPSDSDSCIFRPLPVSYTGPPSFRPSDMCKTGESPCLTTPTDPVFPGLTTQNVRDRLKVLGKRIGVRLTPHLFRHAFTTHMLNRGANLRAVQEMLGHKSVCSTFIYWDSTDKHITQMLREIYMYLPRARAYLMAHPDCFSDLYDYRESP